MTHTDNITQFDDGTYMALCVSYLIIRLAKMSLFSVTTIKLYVGGRYKLSNQCKVNQKLIFYVVIPHVYQCTRKIMKI